MGVVATSSCSSSSSSSSSSATAVRISTVSQAPLQETFDEQIVPSLALKALTIQHTELFCLFVMTAFPVLFSSFRIRVDLNWMDYMRDHFECTASSALTWAVRCLVTYYIGALQRGYDQIRVNDSRHIYNRGLRQLRRHLQCRSSRLTNETLAAAMLLSVYEMIDGSGTDSWLQHSGGIAHLLRLRGWRKHRDDFGHTLYLSYRCFLVAEAFIKGEKCMFEDPEWQRLIDQTIEANERNGRTSVLGDISEYAFKEIVKCPGLIVAVREELHRLSSNNRRRPEGKQTTTDIIPLLNRIRSVRDTLCGLHAKLAESLTIYNSNNNTQNGIYHADSSNNNSSRQKFLGYLPAEFVDSFSSYTLHGMHSAIVLLDQLVRCLMQPPLPAQDHHHSVVRVRAAADIEIWPDDDNINKMAASGSSRFTDWKCKSLVTEAFTQQQGYSSAQDWLDHIAMSMGMAGVQIIPINVVRHQQTPETL
jgi:hypothetical protein